MRRLNLHKKHFEKLNTLSDADKADKFFKFHIADIAMGSGHFVAAIDKLNLFAKWLEQNPIPSIKREIQFLREASKNELELADTLIEDSQLLRRLIARRCIFEGIKLISTVSEIINLIHTFVPGLPLSLLIGILFMVPSIGVESLDIVYKKSNEGENTLKY